ncbi:MAG: acyltransferase family protein, partial [Thermoactinomyces sp.]
MMVQHSKKSKGLVQQIFFIRCVACFSVVLIHALTDTLIVYELEPITTKVLKNIQMVLMFATPMFVLISEFVLGFSDSRSKNFWRKRIQFILIPYLAIGFVYAIIPYIERGFANFELVPFIVRVSKIYFPGSWHGYFVIIIFQFYILHYFFKHLLDRYSARIMIPISFVINFGFLYYTNFAPRIDHPVMHWYYENKIFVILFAGWIFYFVVAYYSG